MSKATNQVTIHVETNSENVDTPLKGANRCRIPNAEVKTLSMYVHNVRNGMSMINRRL